MKKGTSSNLYYDRSWNQSVRFHFKFLVQYPSCACFLKPQFIMDNVLNGTIPWINFCGSGLGRHLPGKSLSRMPWSTLFNFTVFLVHTEKIKTLFNGLTLTWNSIIFISEFMQQYMINKFSENYSVLIWNDAWIY